MSIIDMFRSTPQSRLRFVLVNDRMPRAKRECASCGTKLEQSYLRELHTSSFYCDPQCLAGRRRLTKPVRMAS